MHRVGKTYPGGRQVIRDITLAFLPGAKIGVLGLNGSGKSTLLRIMAGLDHDIAGEARPAEGLQVGYLAQEPELDSGLDVRENVLAGIQPIRDLLDRFTTISARFAEPMDDAEMEQLIAEQGEVQEAIDAIDGWSLDQRAERAMQALRCPDGSANITHLSGGERRRVALARLLLASPDMLLLDEPTNHLDADSVYWLEQFLKNYPGTVIAVTHDRYFLDNVAGWILELDRGRGIPWQGNYSSWLEQKEKRMASEEKTDQARQRVIARELEWIRSSPRARQAKSKSRITAFEALAAEARERSPEPGRIVLPAPTRLGRQVVSLQNIRKAYDGRVLLDGFSFDIPPGAIVGIIGANGMGKTTLFRLITGQEQPDHGTVVRGETVVLGHVDQSRADLRDDRPIWEEIADGVDEIEINGHKIHARTWCNSFNFRGPDQQKTVAQLSGGERNRAHLAKTLRKGANVLLLDEPTNDLDIDTLRSLEDALLEFPGTALIISHDRWFLDRIVTHILSFEGDGVVRLFEGNCSDYTARIEKETGESTQKRPKYHRING